MRKVFLEKLPKWGERYKERINWKKSIGYKVKFIYDDIEDEIEIIDYKPKNRVLFVKYKDYNIFKTKTYRFKKCELQGLLKEELLRPKYDENKPRRVDLRKLPLNSNGIDWRKTAKDKMIIPFVYDNINGKIKIVGYDGRCLKVEYMNNKKNIDRALFTEGKIGNIIAESIINLEDYYIQNKSGYIDLRNLPKKIGGIDWINSINYIVQFEYENIKGVFKIIKYYNKEQKIKILYNNKKFDIQTSSIYNIGFSWIIGKVTKEYRYNIGDVINDIKIIDYIKIKNGNQVPRKGYKYECLKCGYVGENSENHFKSGRGICPVCCTPARKIVKGINDIATTHPCLIKYFVNKENIYKYSCASNKKVLMICPDCGYKKEMQISNLNIYGFSCPQCRDGKSYGEKFVFNVLNQLDIKFEIEKEFKWSRNIIHQNSELNGNKRYDFYIPSLNCIVETHGGQHYRYTGRGRSLELEQQNDRLKKDLAIANGIKHEKYVVINTINIGLDIIKQNLLNSQLSKIFNLNKINWNKCEEFALSNRVKEICTYWNMGVHNTYQIAMKSKLSRTTIIRYLKIGNNINWCNYNPKKEMQKNGQQSGRKSSKTIICLTTNEIFNSIISAEKKYSIPKSKISLCCKGQRKSTGKHPITGEKLKWMYYEDYLNLYNKKISG